MSTQIVLKPLCTGRFRFISGVEHSGLEPLTSTLPVLRSSQMS